MNPPPPVPPPDRLPLGPEERALRRRLWRGIACSAFLLAAAGFRHSPARGWTALGSAAFVALNFHLLERGLAVILFRLKSRQVVWGVLGILARLGLLLGGAGFAMIHRSRIDRFGLALGGMTIMLAGFFEVAYILYRELRQRCITRG